MWFPFAIYGLSRIWVLIAGIVLARNQIALPIGTANIRIFFPSPGEPRLLDGDERLGRPVVSRHRRAGLSRGAAPGGLGRHRHEPVGLLPALPGGRRRAS